MLRLSSLLVVLLFPLSLAAEPPIKVGAMLHLTGEFAMQGAAFREGVELAADDLNKNGGINGRQIEIVFEDTQYKPLQANIAAKKFAASKDVVATVISVVTEAQAAAKVLETAKLPSIVLWDSSPELEAAGNYLFGIGPWAPASGQESARFAHDILKVTDAVIINTNTEWSVYVSDWFERTFRKLGGRIPGRYGIDPSESDFKSVIVKAKKHNPAIYYVPIDSNIMPFFKQMKQLGVTAPLITSDILDKELFDEGGELFEGVLQTMSGDPNFSETQDMKKLYEEKFGHEPDFLMLTAWGYDAVKVIGESIRRSKPEREAIKDELYKIKDYKGACGTVSFNAKGSAPREVRVFRVKNKEFTPVG